MKNNFYINKVQPKVQKKNVEKKNRVLAILLLCLFAFWSICSVLGLIAYFRDDDIKSVSADTLYNTYRDSIIVDPSSEFFYKSYDFIGSPSANFSSPFRIVLNTTSISQLRIFLRFDESNYTSPNGFNLFYNGATKTSPSFTRVLIDDITYYTCSISSSIMSDIVNLYGGQFSLISLSYDYSTAFSYDFDMFVVRGSSQVYSPAYFEGFLMSDSYDLGYSAGLSSSKTNLFVNGSGSLMWYFENDSPTDLHSAIINPSTHSDYFINGELFFSKLVIDTIGLSNLSRVVSLYFYFDFLGPLTIGVNNYLSARFIGTFVNPAQNVPLSLNIDYYYDNLDTTSTRVAYSSPVLILNSDGAYVVNDYFKTTNVSTDVVDGNTVYNYGDVQANRFTISVSSPNDYFLQLLRNGSNSISLAFPYSSNSDYYAGYIAGQLSFNGDNFYKAGYNEGMKFANSEYNRGYANGAANANDYTFLGLLGAVVDAPIQALTGLLNVEILGFNMLGFFLGLVTLALTIFVVRLFI